MSALEQRPAGSEQSTAARAERIAEILTAVVGLSRELATSRSFLPGRRLSRSQVDALYLVAHSPLPVTPSRLAAVLGVTAGAVTQLVDTLQAGDLITREPNPYDARSQVLRLTPATRAEIEAYESQTVTQLLPRFATLTDRQLTSLADLLRKLSP